MTVESHYVQHSDIIRSSFGPDFGIEKSDCNMRRVLEECL